MAVLYSESKFEVEFRFREEEAIWFSSRIALDHVRNIQINTISHMNGFVVDTLPPGPCSKYLNDKQQVWKVFLSCLSRTNTVRNTFGIKCSVFFGSGEPIPEWVYQCLKMLGRFRTVFVELENDSSHKMPGFKGTYVDPKPMMEAMEKYLEHTLGPGVVNCTYDSDHHWKTLTLTFHPQQHMPAILRARAETLRAEADVLDQEANEAEGQLGGNISTPYPGDLGIKPSGHRQITPELNALPGYGIPSSTRTAL